MATKTTAITTFVDVFIGIYKRMVTADFSALNTREQHNKKGSYHDKDIFRKTEIIRTR